MPFTLTSSRLIALGFFAALLLSFVAFQTISSHGKPKTEMSSERPHSVRFVIVSDTHRIYDHPIPAGDVLIHAGDSEFSANEMNKYMKSFPHPIKIVICGNMDYRLQREQETLQKVTYLQDSEVDISGIKVYGSPWTPEFVGVFQLEGDEAGRAVWENIPDDVDVLLTHGPPRGILDRTSRGMRVGDSELLKRVQEIKPRVHCFGHVHESYGTKAVGDTLFCNAAVFNGQPPIVIDVPTDRSKPASLK